MLESVAITQPDADHADAVVRFRIFKDDKEKTMQTLKMVAENGRWVIDDIVSNHGSVLQAVNSENENAYRYSFVAKRTAGSLCCRTL